MLTNPTMVLLPIPTPLNHPLPLLVAHLLETLHQPQMAFMSLLTMKWHLESPVQALRKKNHYHSFPPMTLICHSKTVSTTTLCSSFLWRFHSHPIHKTWRVYVAMCHHGHSLIDPYCFYLLLRATIFHIIWNPSICLILFLPHLSSIKDQ